MYKKRFSILLALLLALPLFTAMNEEHLGTTLKDLRHNLQRDYQKMSRTRERLTENYDNQHQKMVDIMKQCN